MNSGLGPEARRNPRPRALLLFCCAIVGAPVPTWAQVRAIEINTPDVGVVSEAEVGQAIVTATRGASNPTTTRRDAIRLKEDVRAKGTFGLRWVLPTGTVLDSSKVTSKGSQFVGTIDEISLGEVFKRRGGVVLPGSTGRRPLLWVEGPFGNLEYPVEEFKFEAVEPTVSTSYSSFFKQELVYAGISQGTVAITYKEYKDDQIRPAFTQELRFDLKEGNQVGFRGARVRIIKAGNVSIQYVVEKALSGS